MTSWARVLLRGCAAASIGLGGMVLVGWWAHLPRLIQIYPHFVGMRFNTALCFVVAGIALALADRGQTRWAQSLGAFLVVFGGLVFSQDVTGRGLGLDELFIRDYIPMGTAAPGRMAPNTSLCFVAFGVACLAERTSRRVWTSWVQSLSASVLVALGGLTLFGYLTGVTTFLDWGRFVYMAAHTSVGMVLLALGIFLNAWVHRMQGEDPPWLPVPFGMTVLVATLVLWRALTNQERHLMERILGQEGATLQQQLYDDFHNRQLALIRMAKRWEAGRLPAREEWEADAALYVQHQIGYRAMEWVDEKYRIRWVVPQERNETVIGLDLSKDPVRRAPYERAAGGGRPVTGPDIDLYQGGRGFIHCIAVNRKGRPDGFITAVFEIPKWMDAVWRQPKQVVVEVLSEGRTLYHSGPGSVEQGVAMDFAFEGRHWQLKVFPTQALRNQVRTIVPNVVLIAGTVFAVLIAALVRALQGAKVGARRLREANQNLEAEAKERQRVELALKEADVSRSVILENATVGIGLVRERRLTWVNHRLADMLGVPYDSVLGAPTRVLYPDDETYQYVGREGYPVLAEGKVFETELQLKRFDGEPFWCRFVGRALDPSQPHSGSIWMFEDIDARVRSERMKRQFVSTVSHELRTPLTAIKGALGLLKSGVGGSLSDQAMDLLALASANSDRLIRLVNEILDMEKLRVGRMEFQFEAKDLNESLRDAAEGNLGLATQATVLLGCTPHPTAAWARVDPHRLRQVLDNLISNAVKFSAPGTRVDLALADAGSTWVVTVKDEGRGIPDAFLPYLFEPFTQADGGDSRDRGGTGLGLSITKSLVEGMGGRIRVESQVGKGSTFYIEFPHL
jgi:PAS domain S-box-containing protein